MKYKPHKSFKNVKPIDVERKERAEKHRQALLNAHPRRKRRNKVQWVDTLKRELPAAYRKSESKSLDSNGCHTFLKDTPRYQGKMAEREALAQQELERKKMRVAPLYNKGGLQYISDDTDLHDIGRKK